MTQAPFPSEYGGRLPKEKLPLPCWYSASKFVVTIILIPSFIPRDFGGFAFGDSKSGNWSEEIKDLPVDIQQIKVTFFGNYE